MKLDLPIKEFIPEISKQLPWKHPKNLKQEIREIVEQVDSLCKINQRKEVIWVTIDDAKSPDLDDWLWAERKKDWWYVLYVSIADPTEYIKPLSALDLEALNRWSSVYLLDDYIIHMYPTILATDKFSLNHNTKRATLTVQIEYDNQMNITNSNIEETIYHNIYRLDHESFKNQFFYQWETKEEKLIHDKLQLLNEIWHKLWKKRESKLIITDFYDADRRIWANTKSTKNIISLLVREAALATNITAANFQYEKNNWLWSFRKHMEEYMWKDYKWTLERALYSSISWWHFWLQELRYCHFSSPIRRYADNIVHRVIKCILNEQEIPYSKQDFWDIQDEYLNLQINALVFLERQYHFWNRVTKKTRKNRDAWEENSPSNLKQHLRNWAERWYKLPEKVKYEIIDNIKNKSRDSWSWALWVFLVSKETELVEVLKERVLSLWAPKTFINILTEVRVQRKQDKVFKYSEEINDWNINLKIKYNWKKIVEVSDLFFEEDQWKIEHRLRTKLLEQLFDYFIDLAKKDEN